MNTQNTTDIAELTATILSYYEVALNICVLRVEIRS